MAVWRIPVCLYIAFLAIANVSTSDETFTFSCQQVRELFEGNIGSPTDLHANPQQESESSLCRRGSQPSHLSCCSVQTEQTLAQIAEKRLKENVRAKNQALKKHLMNSLARYQDRLIQLTQEASNRTSLVLKKFHKLPWAGHRIAVTSFFSSLERTLDSNDIGNLEEVVWEFFKHLFPAVFDYVLSNRGLGEAGLASNAEYRACLTRYASQIQPFGVVPEHLYKRLRSSFQHAFIFQETMKSFIDSMTSAEVVSMDSDCKRALVRLQVCHGCRGVSVKGAEVKPCRGTCMNVMRGCLAKISEISSSWDDLIMAFENLQVGMLGRHELQRVLMYVDMNITDAIMHSMTDSARIYDEVVTKCQSIPNIRQVEEDTSSSHDLLQPVVTDSIPPRGTEQLIDFHNEIRALVIYLDDSKGMFNRLADAVCQNSSEYDQDMQSGKCWNGTAVGRYMEEVPENNFLSQARRNTEVKVSLIPDYSLLQVKDTLTHMRRNLSGLLNSDVMMGDQPYRNSAGSKSIVEGSGRQDVIVDDEDLVATGSSGSGSGSGGDQEDNDNNTPNTVTTKTPPSNSGVTRASSQSRTSSPSRTSSTPRSVATSSILSALLLWACMIWQTLLAASV